MIAEVNEGTSSHTAPHEDIRNDIGTRAAHDWNEEHEWAVIDVAKEHRGHQQAQQVEQQEGSVVLCWWDNARWFVITLICLVKGNDNTRPLEISCLLMIAYFTWVKGFLLYFSGVNGLIPGLLGVKDLINSIYTEIERANIVVEFLSTGNGNILSAGRHRVNNVRARTHTHLVCWYVAVWASCQCRPGAAVPTGGRLQLTQYQRLSVWQVSGWTAAWLHRGRPRIHPTGWQTSVSVSNQLKYHSSQDLL